MKWLSYSSFFCALLGLLAPVSGYACEQFLIPQEPIEEAAYSILEQITVSGEDATHELHTWLVAIKERQDSGQPIRVLEHITIAFALRTRFLEGNPDSSMTQIAFVVLSKSWHDLTGKEQPLEKLLDRLPKSVLRRESAEVQQFHAASFQIGTPKEASSEVAFGKDYVWKLRDLLPATMALAFGFSQTGSQVLAGAFMGLTMASIAEHLIHRYISHAPKSLERIYSKMGWLGKRLLGAKFSHAEIHHKRTFKKYTVQFSSAEEKAAVDALLDEQGHLGDVIRQSGYGKSLGRDGIIGGVLVTLPFTAALTAIAHCGAKKLGFEPDAVFDSLAAAGSLSYMLFSKYVHPYLHMSRAESLEKAGPAMRWILDTRYVAMISRLHYGHHRGRGGNYNLLFGADWLLGVLRKPTIEQLLEMRELGLRF